MLNSAINISAHQKLFGCFNSLVYFLKVENYFKLLNKDNNLLSTYLLITFTTYRFFETIYILYRQLLLPNIRHKLRRLLGRRYLSSRKRKFQVNRHPFFVNFPDKSVKY